MENNHLINKVLLSIKKERILIDKMIFANERDDVFGFEELQKLYKSVCNNTDILVSNLLSNIDLNTLENSLLDDNFGKAEDDFDKITLIKIIEHMVYDSFSIQLDELNPNSFIEEHNRYLYSTYLWFINNDETLSLSAKKSLHKYMSLKATGSEFFRRFFSGDYEAAERISTPNEQFDYSNTDKADKAYYSILNDLVKESNNTEAFDSFLDNDELFEARKKFVVLQFMAICSQMMDNDICFPIIENQSSDFTIEIIKEASFLSDNYKLENIKPTKKVINL